MYVVAGRIRLEVYGTCHHLDLDPARALVDALRDALRLAPILAVGERQDTPTPTSHLGSSSVVE
ncbi:hypothetical protein [Rhodococcus ruber]|uniref:hypothetical protein n=1 Tax=Rhodococcus ruber TaxID=1830 RepID=UPI001317FC77|nr:hypothetical protein [Rhodococcus ruber]QGS70798.1 hypothetical protein E2561_25380 [Rhodococcus ruber]